jgi:flagellar basal body-associated protein FliL
MAKEAEDSKETKTEAAAAPPASRGGLQAWLPLIVSVVMMPVLAYGLTSFVLIPKLRQELGGGKEVQAREPAPAPQHGGGKEEKAPAPQHGGGNSKESGKLKNKAVISKVIVNVSGSLGSRMLLASFTLAGASNDLKTQVEEHMDQLRDLAASTLASKTIADLEKPEARNLIRAELMSQFNAALGGNVIQEIYLTEFAIQ